MTKNTRTVGGPYHAVGPQSLDAAATPSLLRCILANDDGHFFGAEKL